MDAVQLEREFGIQIDKVRLDLGENKQFEFNTESNGNWTQVGQTSSNKSKSTPTNSKLEGENNMLKLQVELLLNMVNTIHSSDFWQ